jgi:endonuclease/exonuclease/phosphatase family metal-dependent hydrolase
MASPARDRARAFVALAAATAAVLAAALLGPAAAPARPVYLTAMTFNIASAVETDNNLGPIADAIGAYNPDVVGLQEVDRSWSRSDSVDQPDQLALLLGLYWSFDETLDCVALDYDGDGFCQYGTAILSRFPLRAAASREYGLPRLGDDEPRTLGRVGIVVGGRRITVYNTQLSGLAQSRPSQVRAILRVARATRGPFVLLGDFNARPDAPEIGLLRRHLVDAAQVAHERRPTTGNTRIDYVFASPGTHVVWATVPPGSAPMVSDHRPLIARLRFGS